VSIAGGSVLTGCAPGTPVAEETPSPAAEGSPTPVTPVASPTVAVPTVPQELKIAVTGLAPTLDGFHTSFSSYQIYNLIYDPLVRVDQEGNPRAALATSWEVLEPTVWQFKLREGVTFHNGETFDAEDVKASIEYYVNPENEYRNIGHIQLIESVEVVDEYTVNIHTSEPFAAMLAKIMVLYLWPNEYVEEVGMEGLNQRPIGTGPFKFVEWALDDHITFEGNPDYWGGAPKLDSVRYVQMPEAATRLAALEAGEMDMIEDVPPEQVQRLEGLGFNVETVLFGQAWVLWVGQMNTRTPPLESKLVRQAIAYAIDIDAIVDGITLGYARKLEGQMCGPDGFGWDPNQTAYPYDVEKARQLMADAGYADGFSVTFTYPTGRYFKGKEISEAIAAYLSEINIDVELVEMDFGAWAEPYLAGETGPLTHTAQNYMPGMDCTSSLAELLCIQGRFWCAPEMDEAYDRQAIAMDPEQRREDIAEMSALVKEEVPVVSVLQVPGIYAFAPKVHDVGVGSDHLIFLDNAFIE
jgi:peptide/nickel transport system substrate-binding protein